MLDTSEVVFKAKLVAIDREYLGYVTLVFQNLEPYNSECKYIMCVKFPNWNIVIPEIGIVGFVKVKYIVAGMDKWFDGNKFNHYRYTNVQLLKFIPESPKTEEKLIID